MHIFTLSLPYLAENNDTPKGRGVTPATINTQLGWLLRVNAAQCYILLILVTLRICTFSLSVFRTWQRIMTYQKCRRGVALASMNTQLGWLLRVNAAQCYFLLILVISHSNSISSVPWSRYKRSIVYLSLEMVNLSKNFKYLKIADGIIGLRYIGTFLGQM